MAPSTERIAEQLSDKARELQQRYIADLDLDEARRNLDDAGRRVTTFIRERPGTCLLGALAVGFVVGKLASRR